MAGHPEYKAVFDAIPLPSLLLKADPLNYKIVDANDAYLEATRTKNQDLIGRGLFEAIPEHSGDERSVWMKCIRTSLDTVMDTRETHKPEIQEYDIPITGGVKTKIRFWKAVNAPVMDEGGEVVFIIHSVTDVTDQVIAEQKEFQTEEKLQNIVAHSTNLFYSHSREGVLNYVSPQCSHYFGYGPEDSQRKWTEFITDHPVNKIGLERTQRAIDIGERQPSYELQLQKRNGEIIWVEVNEAPIVKDGKTIEIVGSLTDITAAKFSEEHLISVNKKLKNAQHIAKIGYWENNLETNEIYWSDEVYQITGMNKESFTPDPENVLELIHPEDADKFLMANEHAIKSEKKYDAVFRLLLPDKSIRWVHEKGSFRFNEKGKAAVFEGTVQDITIQKIQKEELLDSLKEKDTLLSEIHHRVKNNLAVVSGLLELQKNSVPHAEVQKTLTNSQLRIKSMAMIHEQLYQRQRLSRIHLRDVLEELIPAVRSAFDIEEKVDIRLDCDQVQLNINQALPCTLIINELLSNAFEHAFQEKTRGRIDVKVKISGEIVDIAIEDNGKGLCEETIQGKIKTMGYTIIKTLIKQIRADLKIRYKNGGSVRFTFKKEEVYGSSSRFIN